MKVFKKYDDLNASVQENVNAIRVVKAYVREDHEIKKFEKAADNVYKLFVKAESILAIPNVLLTYQVFLKSISASSYVQLEYIEK